MNNIIPSLAMFLPLLVEETTLEEPLVVPLVPLVEGFLVEFELDEVITSFTKGLD